LPARRKYDRRPHWTESFGKQGDAIAYSGRHTQQKCVGVPMPWQAEYSARAKSGLPPRSGGNGQPQRRGERQAPRERFRSRRIKAYWGFSFRSGPVLESSAGRPRCQ
jgi:hypothetical protein